MRDAGISPVQGDRVMRGDIRLMTLLLRQGVLLKSARHSAGLPPHEV
jgi:hypothetical protein